MWILSKVLPAIILIGLARGSFGDNDSSAAWSAALNFPAEMVSTWPNTKEKHILQTRSPHILVWIPDRIKRARAMILVANNTDLIELAQYGPIRDVATRYDTVILFLQHFPTSLFEGESPPDSAADIITSLFRHVETASGVTGISTAPWITIGKSSRGKFAFRPAWMFPERTIATISYHGETPTWPLPEWAESAAAHSILHLSVNGLTEWAGTWYRHVRPALLNYNSRTRWLAHQAVIYGVDHGYYVDYYLYPNYRKEMPKDHRHIRVTDVWDYIAAFMETALRLRLPADSALDVGLRDISRDSGILLHPRIIEELLGLKWFALRRDEHGAFQPIPWPDEPSPVFDEEQGLIPPETLVRMAANGPVENPDAWYWAPDRDLLRAWLKLHNVYPRLASQLLSSIP